MTKTEVLSALVSGVISGLVTAFILVVLLDIEEVTIGGKIEIPDLDFGRLN